MSAPQPGAAAAVSNPDGPRIRAAVLFGIEGDLRFLSHHDEMRMLTRAVTRAAWPLAYSRGFNPQPRITLPLPRAVGTASAAELAVIDLAGTADAETLRASLAGQMPADAPLHRVATPLPTGTPHPVTVDYAVDLTDEQVGPAAERLAQVLAADRLMIERQYGSGKRPRPIDVRPLIESVALEGSRLTMRLRYEQQGTARPGEVMQCLGLAADDCEHRIRRLRVEWDMQLEGAPD